MISKTSEFRGTLFSDTPKSQSLIGTSTINWPFSIATQQIPIYSIKIAHGHDRPDGAEPLGLLLRLVGHLRHQATHVHGTVEDVAMVQAPQRRVATAKKDQGSNKGGGVVQLDFVDTERNAQGARIQNASACTFFATTKCRA